MCRWNRSTRHWGSWRRCRSLNTAAAPASIGDIVRPPFAEPLADGTKSYSVLLIEDSPTYRGVMRMLLQGAGYTVMEADNGILGVDIARLQKPDRSCSIWSCRT